SRSVAWHGWLCTRADSKSRSSRHAPCPPNVPAFSCGPEGVGPPTLLAVGGSSGSHTPSTMSARPTYWLTYHSVAWCERERAPSLLQTGARPPSGYGAAGSPSTTCAHSKDCP